MIVQYGNSLGKGRYVPPVLLPNIEAYFHSEDKRSYVVREIVKQASEGTLYLTDYLSSPRRIRDMVGMIMKGVCIDDDKKEMVAHPDGVHPLIAGYKVKIQVIDDRAKTIKFKNGKVIDPNYVKLAENVQFSVGGDVFNSHRRLMVDRWFDYEAKEAELFAGDAWVCLMQHGEFCIQATSLRLQERLWLYREVAPVKRKK
jgi:hypothetical protein